MVETKLDSSVKSATNIRVIGLNTDKTRRMIASETVYQVYFELSGVPPQGWVTMFEQEWKALNVGEPLSLQETSVERAFLVMHCPLQEVAKHVPILKNAVAATNIAYDQYVGKQSAELKGREDVWKDERKTVEDVAKSLHFD
jgi:hypothetical protein